MQSIKEKKLLVKFAQSMGQPIDPGIVEEVKKYEEMQSSIKESIRSNMMEDLRELFDTAVTSKVEEVKEQVEVVVEEVEVTPPPKVQEETQPSLIERSAAVIEKVEKAAAIKEDSYQQPVAPLPADIKAIKEKIKVLEQWISKISLTGPGGGAGEVYNLDMPTTLVTSNSYVVTRKDYYIGVNYAGTVNITLPTNVKQGRYLIIKDESGGCSKYPIIVHGNVDNDPDGFILKINNGGIQMIYRNGWRIV